MEVTTSAKRSAGNGPSTLTLDPEEDFGEESTEEGEAADEAERLLLPGDVAFSEPLGAGVKFVLGVGLRAIRNLANNSVEARATRPGFLRRRGRSYWLDCPGGRYQPARGDCVLGVVVRRSMGDAVLVDIGSSEPANLSLLSFENATKRNRPDVRLGDLVYARLNRCDPGLEPELVCVDSNGRADGLGVVGRDSGVLVVVPPSLARRLLADRRRLLAMLAPMGEYEAAVGLNGRLWLCGSSWSHTVALASAVAAFHQRPEDQCQALVTELQRTVGLASGRS